MNFDVDAYLNGSAFGNLADLRAFHRGEPTGVKLRPAITRSGFQVSVCDQKVESSFDGQLQAAEAFLSSHRDELNRLRQFPGVDEVELSFELYWFADTACYPICLPPSFMLTAGKCGVNVALNICATSDKEQV